MLIQVASVWYSSSTSSHGPVNALTSLRSATSSWTRVPLLNYTYDSTGASANYGILNCVDGTCTFKETSLDNMRARLITGEEVKAITQTASTAADSWTPASGYSSYYYYTSSTNQELAWLIENTTADSTYGSTNNIYGSNSTEYWTLSPVSNYSSQVWSVHYKHLNNSNISFSNGVRPVITVPKSDLN